MSIKVLLLIAWDPPEHTDSDLHVGGELMLVEDCRKVIKSLD